MSEWPINVLIERIENQWAVIVIKDSTQGKYNWNTNRLPQGLPQAPEEVGNSVSSSFSFAGVFLLQLYSFVGHSPGPPPSLYAAMAQGSQRWPAAHPLMRGTEHVILSERHLHFYRASALEKGIFLKEIACFEEFQGFQYKQINLPRILSLCQTGIQPSCPCSSSRHICTAKQVFLSVWICLPADTVYEISYLSRGGIFFWPGRINCCGNWLPHTNTWKAKHRRGPVFHLLCRRQWPSG